MRRSPLPRHLPAPGRKELGEEVRARRIKLKLSLYALARQAKVAPQTIANIEQGRTSTTVDMLERFSFVLGVRPARLDRKSVV